MAGCLWSQKETKALLGLWKDASVLASTTLNEVTSDSSVVLFGVFTAVVLANLSCNNAQECQLLLRKRMQLIFHSHINIMPPGV